MTSNLDETLYFNGVNGATGGYFFEPQTIAQVSEIAQESIIAEQVNGYPLSNRVPENSHLKALIQRDRPMKDETERPFGPIPGVDVKELSQTGWGIIFPGGNKFYPVIREALDVLITHRKEKAGYYFKEYKVYKGVSADEFLSRYEKYQVDPKVNNSESFFHHGVAVSDPADPRKVPYYLLIVGDFWEIPFDFQYQLDVQYAVGRIYFKTPQEYYQYARSVVEAETTKLSLPCKANLFGVCNEGDRATELSADYLVKPLQKFLTSDDIFLKKNSHWKVETRLAEEATKAQLSQLLRGKETPAFLFTASHGIAFPNKHGLQFRHQGAFICQDWPGPSFGEPIPEDHYFSADDVGDDDRLWGLISFHFACFGGGTPQMDQFGHRKNDWQEIAPYSFMAKLPQRLLSHPKGGALAFISHVDRAWGYSFGGNNEQITTFTSTLQQLMEGYPVGYAVEYFNQRYAAMSSELTDDLWHIKSRRLPDDYRLSSLWTANNDARGYAIIGDPAVRLMVGNDASKLEERPEIEYLLFSPKSSPNQLDDSEKLDELDATPDTTLPDESLAQNPTEKELSHLVNSLNQLSQRVERLKQKNLTEDNLSELNFSLKNFNRTVQDIEEKDG